MVIITGIEWQTQISREHRWRDIIREYQSAHNLHDMFTVGQNWQKTWLKTIQDFCYKVDVIELLRNVIFDIDVGHRN